MTQFDGFPEKMEYAAVPAVFFSRVLPQITDITELKTTLYFFRLILVKKNFPRFVTFSELAADTGLANSLKSSGIKLSAALRTAMNAAIAHGTILHLQVDGSGSPEDVYFLNTARDREAVEKIKTGEIKLPGLTAKEPLPESPAEPASNIFQLYEHNIGLLTPMLAEELKDAEKNYPSEWIEDAFREAVSANKRNWRYIARLLERWATEGKKDGTYQRDFKTADPDKFVRGKYGHLFQR
jgi:DNA replication protein